MTGTGTGTRIVREGLPGWLLPVRDAAERLEPRQLSRFLPPAEGGRRSAVLVLFGTGPEGPARSGPTPASPPSPAVRWTLRTATRSAPAR